MLSSLVPLLSLELCHPLSRDGRNIRDCFYISIKLKGGKNLCHHQLSLGPYVHFYFVASYFSIYQLKFTTPLKDYKIKTKHLKRWRPF